LLGLSFGQAAGAVSSNFASQYRYTGAALTSDLSWLTGAGFAPLVALGLSSKFGLGWVSVYLLSGAVCTLVALLFNKLETHESSGKSIAPATGPRSRGRESMSRAH
jgi:hypothetical protein